MGASKSCFSAREADGMLSATYQVPDGLRSAPRDNQSHEGLNVNEATEDELMTLPGVNRATARNIVEYRTRIGGFRRVEDLALVSGLGAAKLAAIRNEITIGVDSPSASSAALNRTPSKSKSSIKAAARRSLSLNFSNLSASQTDLLSQLPLGDYLSRKFVLPTRTPDVLRVGTWNLQQCTNEKLQNIGVLEVICSTILEQDIALIALQEIGDKEVVDTICNELNRPNLIRLRRSVHEMERAGLVTGQWRGVAERTGRMFQSDEFAAFIYDASRVTLRGSSLLDKDARGADRLFTRSPFVCVAEAGKLRLVICNLHLKCPGLAERDGESRERNEAEIANLHLLVRALESFRRTLSDPSQPHVLVVGDLNADPVNFHFDSLRLNGYHSVLSQKDFTNISVKSKAGSHVYDHLWVSADGQPSLTGQYRVVRENLTHPLVPAGWQWNGYVSDHCPVYCDLRAGPAVAVANNGGLVHDARSPAPAAASTPKRPQSSLTKRTLFTLEE